MKIVQTAHLHQIDLPFPDNPFDCAYFTGKTSQKSELCPWIQSVAKPVKPSLDYRDPEFFKSGGSTPLLFRQQHHHLDLLLIEGALQADGDIMRPAEVFPWYYR